MENEPLIVTLGIDSRSQYFFDALREKHFPPERNFLAAHVTLFHHLPGAELPAVTAGLERLASGLAAFSIPVTGVISLGRGVAYRLESTEVTQLHRAAQASFAQWLTPQDAQSLRPHVTVQNKVTPAVARNLKAALEADFEPFDIIAQSVRLWHYRGGPWEWVRDFEFIG